VASLRHIYNDDILGRCGTERYFFARIPLGRPEITLCGVPDNSCFLEIFERLYREPGGLMVLRDLRKCFTSAKGSSKTAHFKWS
jgi:hypothetical protein